MENFLNANVFSHDGVASACGVTVSFDELAGGLCADDYIGAAIVKEREKMPEKAKTLMHIDSYGKNLFLKIADGDGYVDCDKFVMSDIVDVEVVHKPYKSQVIVEFADGTYEAATLSRNDEFNLEQGISICVAKKLFSNIVGTKYGSSTYNKIIDHAVKVYMKCEREKEKMAAEEEHQKQKYEKEVAKKKAKRLKREEEERERQIEIQKEAILRALNQWNTHTAD